MGPLRQEELSDTFKRLLDARQGENVEVRRLALRGLGDLANAQSVGVIMSGLDDPSERIRLEAVQALTKNPALPEYAEPLRLRLDPQEESSESVRQAAWVALQAAFPSLPKAS